VTHGFGIPGAASKRLTEEIASHGRPGERGDDASGGPAALGFDLGQSQPFRGAQALLENRASEDVAERVVGFEAREIESREMAERDEGEPEVCQPADLKQGSRRH
jgi:hypothetical protein